MAPWGEGFARVPHAAIAELTSSPRDHAAMIVLLAIISRVRYVTPGRHNGVELDVGQAVLGQRELGQRLGLDRKVVRTALAKLEARGYIVANESPEGTVVTVIGWKSTAHPQNEPSQAGPRRGPRTGPPRSAANLRDAHEYQRAGYGLGAHVEARLGAHLGPTSGPPRAPNEEEKEGDQDLGSSVSEPDPDQHLGADRVRRGPGGVELVRPHGMEAYEAAMKIARGGAS